MLDLLKLMELLRSYDIFITQFISQRSLPAFLELFLYPGGTVFGYQGMLLVWPLVFYWTTNLTIAIRFITSAALGQCINRLLKLIASRDRPVPPFPLPVRHFTVRVPSKHASGDGPSFPSGDAMAAGCVAGAFFFIGHGHPLTLLFAVWGMCGRMFYHCHFFFDTLVGASIGLTSTIVVSNMKRSLTPVEVLYVIPIFYAGMYFSKYLAQMVRTLLRLQEFGDGKNKE